LTSNSKSLPPLPNWAPDWQKDGQAHVWLPYAQMQTTPPPLAAKSAAGARIELYNGKSLIDGVSSWWTAAHGYNHPHINQAIQVQMADFSHLMLGGFANAPAYQLATRLAEKLPADLNHVFFTESGSVSVEVALKTAIQYHLNKGKPHKQKIISFLGGYHGDTLGTMAVCDPEEGMHSLFAGVLPEQFIVPVPVTDAEKATFRAFVAEHADQCAAIVIEPLVQGAGGFRQHGVDTLQCLRDCADEFDLILIFDEIMTGFARLGRQKQAMQKGDPDSLFVCGQTGVVPDIITLSKALTGGTLPLAATISRSHVFEAFLGEDPDMALMHGPTFMGNALACAAANASLDLFEQEDRLGQVDQIESEMSAAMTPLLALPHIEDVRVIGALGVVQVDQMRNLDALKARFVEQGVWVRPFRDVIYIMPPMMIEKDDLASLLDIFVGTVTDWANEKI